MEHLRLTEEQVESLKGKARAVDRQIQDSVHELEDQHRREFFRMAREFFRMALDNTQLVKLEELVGQDYGASRDNPRRDAHTRPPERVIREIPREHLPTDSVQLIKESSASSSLNFGVESG